MHFIYNISQWIALLFVRAFFPPISHLKIYGKENIEHIDEPVILIANHNSRFDPVYMTSFLPWHLYKKMMPFRFMTLGATMRKLRSIPGLYIVGCYAVEPGSGTLDEVLKKSMNILKKSENALVMFPDSPLHKVGEPPFAKPGIACLGKHSGRLIVPIGLSGMRPFGFWNFWKGKTHVTLSFGKPFYYKDVVEKDDDFRDTARIMMAKVYELLEK